MGTSISEMLDTEYRGVSLIYGCDDAISDCDFVDRVSVVEQIQTYHQQYGESQKKNNFASCKMEHQRMLIEQQTFSATPQVTNRAVTELNMF